MKERKSGRILLRVLITLVLCGIICLATFMTTYLRMKSANHSREADLVQSYQEVLDSLSAQVGTDETLYYMQSVVDRYFYGEPGEWNPQGTMDDVYRDYIDSLDDPYAEYYSPEEYETELSDRQGTMVGIGVQVLYDSENQNIRIIQVIPGSPAEAAGILADDRIVAVDGRRISEIGNSEAMNAIPGEIGTIVKITVLRGDRELEVPITRNTYVNVSVYGSLCADKKTGLIRITGFDGATPDQFKAAVDSLLESGAERLIFDVRNNGGGLLSSVLSVLSYLVEKDQVLIHIYDKDGNVETNSSDDNHTVDVPMALLINENTASAAELFTACLRDLKDAELVGETTFGKGCMQSYFSLPNGGGMKLTYKMYTPPCDVSYHGIGIVPDVAAKLDSEFADTPLALLSEEQDRQLQAAIAALNG